MNSSRTLELLLKEILTAIKPSDEDITIRDHVIDEFRDVVASIQSLRGATVEPFGSFVSNLYSRWGDLDISIELSNGIFVSSAERRQKQSSLKDIQKALRRIGTMRILKYIPNARVPLLTFESIRQNISCDISIDNLQGQVKSKFLFWITEIDERFRDMVLLVKEWAIAQNINDPKAGTLNSYSLSLLVIFHFQTCEPPILPPLKEIYAGNMADDLTGLRYTAERNIKNTCAENIARFRSDWSRKINRSSLSDLFVSFFEKFSRIYTRASGFAICTYTGKWEPIRSNIRWMIKTYPLLIEDPLEQAENAARTVGTLELIRISEAFEETNGLLSLSAHRNRRSLIESLVRTQIRSDLLTSAARENSSSLSTRGEYSFGNQPRYIGTMLSRDEFRSTRPETHYANISLQRPGQGQRPTYLRPGQGQRPTYLDG